MSYDDELNGLMRQVGGKRVYVPALGISVWRVPPYSCAFCGLNSPVAPGCPDPLARHGPIEQKEVPA